MTIAWRWTTAAAALAVVIALLPTLHSGLGATYASSTPLLALEALAGIALVAVVALAGVTGKQAILLFVAGGTWLVPELAGIAAIGLHVRTLADAWTHLVPVLLVMAVVRETPDPRRGASRILLTTGVLAGGAAAAARIFLVDPFLDPHCWRTCAHNPLALVGAAPWGTLAHAALVVVGAVTLTVATLTVAAPWPRPSRRSHLAVAALTIAPLLVAGSVVRLLVPERGDSVPWVLWFCAVQASAVTWLGISVSDRWRGRALASRLTALVAILEPARRPSVGLVEALRTAVRDPQLVVAYRAPVRGGYVDATGTSVAAPGPAPGRSVTTLTRHSSAGGPTEIVAVVGHAVRVNGDHLRHALGPALSLALANEQLRAGSLAELAELRRSRARVVQRASLERRRLERNLHDGAQQGLVALSLQVRILANRVDGAAPRVVVDRAAALCAVALDELRRVARGIYPAVLSDAGLDGALVELAEGSPVLPVSVAAVPGVRCAGIVESTAFVVAGTSVEDAQRRGATRAKIRALVTENALRLTVDDDAGPPERFASAALVDQAVALGGSLRVGPGDTGTRVLLELPCGS
jgi:signal transduction histidine kinase